VSENNQVASCLIGVPTVELPLDIHSDVATYETPWGHVQRPTHKNTTWDAAKFEVCGHKVRTHSFLLGLESYRRAYSLQTLASTVMAWLYFPSPSMASRARAMSCESRFCVRQLLLMLSRIKVDAYGCLF
jgi:alpha-mannosidase